MQDPDKCPQPGCGRPESASRVKAGKRLKICANAHHWNPDEIREANRIEAERRIIDRQELKPHEPFNWQGSFYPPKFPREKIRFVNPRKEKDFEDR